VQLAKSKKEGGSHMPNNLRAKLNKGTSKGQAKSGSKKK
jgi:hypothetical protein